MAHGIVKGIDKGIVGNCDVYGGTWHQLKEYAQVNGMVPFEDVVKTLEYKVEKRQVHIPVIQADGSVVMNPVPEMFVLVRADSNMAIHNISVSDEYQIYQNEEFLNTIRDDIMVNNPEIGIESCGSLWGGKIAFVNFMLDRFTVKGDSSETMNRLMYYNAFGGKSIASACHDIRIQCANTLHVACVQGLANETLRKFKHTSGAPKRVKDHLVALMRIREKLKEHKLQLDHLASQPMVVKEVENFLGHMVEIDESDNNTDNKKTRVVNKRGEILEIFEDGVDLQGAIAQTRYAMLQAVTFYTQHKKLNKNTDKAARWFEVIAGGNNQKFNQKAFEILIQDVITTPAGMKIPDFVEESSMN